MARPRRLSGNNLWFNTTLASPCNRPVPHVIPVLAIPVARRQEKGPGFARYFPTDGPLFIGCSRVIVILYSCNISALALGRSSSIPELAGKTF